MSSSCFSARMIFSCLRMSVPASTVCTAAASFCTLIMREASRSVDTVSSRCELSPHMQASITVWQFAPRQSFRMFVSLLCRYGMWDCPRRARATTHCSR